MSEIAITLIYNIEWLCMSLVPVVLHAGWDDQSQCMQLNKTIKTEESDSLSKVKHKHDAQVAMTIHVHRSII